jgi:hypothetical protein
MHNDLPTYLIVAINYELLSDVETMMGLMCVLPMLEAMQGLNETVQLNKIASFVILS